ncbi:hypothetical protein ACLX1H_008479 [Fusarium chlamydosporum]
MPQSLTEMPEVQAFDRTYLSAINWLWMTILDVTNKASQALNSQAPSPAIDNSEQASFIGRPVPSSLI